MSQMTATPTRRIPTIAYWLLSSDGYMNSTLTPAIQATPAPQPSGPSSVQKAVDTPELWLLVALFALGTPLNLYSFYRLRRQSPAAASSAQNGSIAANGASAGGLLRKQQAFATPRSVAIAILERRAAAHTPSASSSSTNKTNSTTTQPLTQHSSKFRTLQKHLNGADLLILFVFTQTELWRLLLQNEWNGGDVLCKLSRMANTWAFHASSNIMATIAIDRALTIDSHYGRLDQFAIKIILTVGWLLALAFSIPQLWLWGTVQKANKSYCVTTRLLRRLDHKLSAAASASSGPHLSNSISNITSNIFVSASNGTVKHSLPGASLLEPTDFEKFYDIFHLLMIFWVPFLIIAICYIRVFFVTILSAKRMKAFSKQRAAIARLKSGTSTIGTVSQTSLRRRKNRAIVLKRGTFLILVYLACWMPYNVLTLWTFISPTSFGRLGHYFRFTYYLIVLNSVLNPFVYRLMQWQRLLPCCPARSRARRLKQQHRQQRFRNGVREEYDSIDSVGSFKTGDFDTIDTSSLRTVGSLPELRRLAY